MAQAHSAPGSPAPGRASPAEKVLGLDRHSAPPASRKMDTCGRERRERVDPITRDSAHTTKSVCDFNKDKIILTAIILKRNRLSFKYKTTSRKRRRAGQKAGLFFFFFLLHTQKTKAAV
jgi:hypothetical protein